MQMKRCDASAAIRGSVQRGDALSWIIAVAIAEVSATGLDRRLSDTITEEQELDRLPGKPARLSALPPPPGPAPSPR